MSEYIVYFGDLHHEFFFDLESCEKYISDFIKDGYKVSNFTIFKEVPFKIQIKLEIGE
jgi:hypothetical protein